MTFIYSKHLVKPKIGFVRDSGTSYHGRVLKRYTSWLIRVASGIGSLKIHIYLVCIGHIAPS